MNVHEVIRSERVPTRVREILNLIPISRRSELNYLGIYICPVSGAEAVILKDDHHFIVCRFGSVIRCTESPSVFMALEGVCLCNVLWKE